MAGNDSRPVSVGNARAMIEAYDEKVWGGGPLPREVVFAGSSRSSNNFANCACTAGSYQTYEVRCIRSMSGEFASYTIPATNGTYTVSDAEFIVSTIQNHHRITVGDSYNDITLIYGIR